MLHIFADALLIAARQNPFRRHSDKARGQAYPDLHAPKDRDDRHGTDAGRDPKW